MHCFICPTYGHYDYAQAAIESFMKWTPTGIAIVVDDGYPHFKNFWNGDSRVIVYHFNERAGLTRSWNYGLKKSIEIRSKYTICGNSDILFTKGWDAGPVALLSDTSVGLVGPLSNAPGLTNRLQNICNHLIDYTPSDDPVNLGRVAQFLRKRHSPASYVAARKINGFFMIGRTERWWEGRFDAESVFNPGSQFALTENENELQSRFSGRGWRNLVSLRCFIFHYRSVTRGDKFNHGLWYRRRA